MPHLPQAEHNRTREDHGERLILGVEGGGTKTEWVLARVSPEGAATTVETGLLPASNLKLSSDSHLVALFTVMPPQATDVGVYLAGCATEGDRARLRGLVSAHWPGARIAIGSDRDSAFAACFGEGDGVVVIAGTGAAVTGRYQGRLEKAGGWGQLLGDRGSGYHLAMRGLRCVLSSYDMHGQASPLAYDILQRLQLNRLQDLVDWVSAAEKMDVAQLAPAIFAAAAQGDGLMQEVLRDGSEILADFVKAVVQRLGHHDLPVRLFGGLFAHHPEYGELVRERLAHTLPGAEVEVCTASGALGAVWLASQACATPQPTSRLGSPIPASGQQTDLAELATATTEQRNPRSQQLDTLPTAELVQLFIDEEHYVTQSLAAVREPIAAAVDLIALSLKGEGRLFYVGAGTSGRLGVLDASEVPPTFGASPELVQGIIAGGVRALYRAVEGAEDEPTAGAHALLDRGVVAGDVVCGLAASGRTPFVLGALQQARELGARTVLLTCNPARHRQSPAWDVEIDLPTGPELVTGSTRLKAGTATKLVLNILTTGAMVRLGKVRGNLMVNVRISNEKLRIRGIRLVAELLRLPEAEAEKRLREAGWNVVSCLDQGEAATI